MDDHADNVISLSQRRLLWEELAATARWATDLDLPLASERRALARHAQAAARARRARRARAPHPAFSQAVAPPSDTAA